MRILLQRVSQAAVAVEGESVGTIQQGYLLLTGIGQQDDESIADRLADKIVGLRLFPNEEGKFDHALLDVSGGALVVSQFTLFGSTKRGRRPDFNRAARPDLAEPLCAYFAEALRQRGVDPVATGRFGAHMDVSLVNDGPVTLWLDSDTL